MASCRSATRVRARPPPPARCHLVVYFLSSWLHFAIAAVSLGAALCRHFVYFWICDELGLPPLEPPEPPLLEPPPRPPRPPPSPPSCCWSSDSGWAPVGAVIFCGSPTFA